MVYSLLMKHTHWVIQKKRDSFAKECIDTLCEALSDNKDKLMVIIAGYEKDLKDCFFNYNQGLESRFTWRFKTDDYTHKELKHIFIKKVKDAGWSFKKEDKIKDTWFEEKHGLFQVLWARYGDAFFKNENCTCTSCIL